MLVQPLNMTKFADSEMIMTPEPSPEPTSNVTPIILGTFFGIFGVILVVVVVAVLMANKKKKKEQMADE